MSGHGLSGKARLLLAVTQGAFDASGARLGQPRLYECVPVDELLAKMAALESSGADGSDGGYVDGYGAALADLRGWLGV